MAVYQFSNAELAEIKAMLILTADRSYEFRALAEKHMAIINQILAARSSRG